MKNKSKQINYLLSYIGMTGGSKKCALELWDLIPEEGRKEGESIKKRVQ